MSRHDHTAPRCLTCGVLATVCVCKDVAPLDLETELCVVIHSAEVRKTTNTGIVATRCVRRSTVLVHGRIHEPLAPPDLAAGRRGLVLFPSPAAVPLTRAHASEGPVSLFVPDGNWGQATRMARRLPWFADFQHVTLPHGPPSRYRLRTETRTHGLATMEAIARALGILEGQAAQRELERVFDLLVERTLFARGTASSRSGAASDARSPST